MSSARHDTQIGSIYWCETARASVGERFSDKERRPVLVVAVEGFSAAVYPCSTRRDERYESEYLGRVYFDLDTYVVYGLGLFDAPIDSLYEPGIPWQEWRSWERRHREMIADDLERLRARLRDRKSLARNDPSGASIASRIPPQLRERLLERASETPPPPPPPRPEPPETSDKDEFEAAMEALPKFAGRKGKRK